MKANSIPSLALRLSRLDALTAWLRGLFATAFLVIAHCPQAATAPPSYMSYQGFLTGSDGVTPLAKDDIKTIDAIFRIYDAATGGSWHYGEKQKISVSDGAFSVLLGQGDALDAESDSITTPYTSLLNLFRPENIPATVYVELQVDADEDTVLETDEIISPRLQLISTPFSLMANSALALSGSSVALSANGDAVSVSKPLEVEPLDGSGDPIAGESSIFGNLVLSGTAEASAGGILEVRQVDSSNNPLGSLIVDQDEIQAKDSSGNVTGLLLNPDGGAVELGKDGFLVTIKGDAKLEGTLDSNVLKTTTSGVDVVGTFSSSELATFSEGVEITVSSDATASGGALALTTSSGRSLFFDNNEIQAASNDSPANLYLNPHGGDVILQGGDLSLPADDDLLLDDGRIGINTTDPSAPLEVWAFVSGSELRSDITKGNGNNTSILARGAVVANKYNTHSDRRIKRILSRLEGAQALDQINRLRVAAYNMLDFTDVDEANHLGFIAQEVEEVIPNAVSKSRNYIPDLRETTRDLSYDAVEKTLVVRLKKEHGLAIGDRVELIVGSKPWDRTVIEVPGNNSFVVGEIEEDVEEVLVYGRQVDDFRTVDYNHIFTLGITAIQETNRRLDESNLRLQEKIAALEKDKELLARQLAAIVERLDQLESPLRIADSSVED